MAASEQKAMAFEQTPEFKAAVQAAAREAVAAAQTELLLAMKSAPDSAEKLMETLALRIAEIGDQGTSRKRVAPEILAQRARAHAEAIDYIHEIRAKDLKPEYALLSAIYAGDRIIPAFMTDSARNPVRTRITFTGMPSEAMRPVNKVAKKLYDLYLASIASTEHLPGQRKAPAYMTAGGQVVHVHVSPARRDFRELPTIDADREAGTIPDDMRVVTQDDPTAPEIHVLGTLAPAAKQNTYGVTQRAGMAQ